MTTWVLILTLFWNGEREAAAAIESIDFGPNKESCIKAGTYWEENIRKQAVYVVPVAVCVPL